MEGYSLLLAALPVGLFDLYAFDFAEGVSEHWHLLLLMGLPKHSLARTYNDFRLVAKSPTLQKLYLRALVGLARSMRKVPRVWTWGFSKGLRTLHVTSLLRLLVLKSVK